MTACRSSHIMHTAKPWSCGKLLVGQPSTRLAVDLRGYNRSTEILQSRAQRNPPNPEREIRETARI